MIVSETLELSIPDDGLDVDRLGLIRFERRKVKYKDKGRFWFLLDDVLGLKPYQGKTRWVRQRALELAVEYPYRQARSLLRHEIMG